MILEGKYLKTVGRMDGQMEVTFEVPNYFQREMSKKIKDTKMYSIEVKEIKDKRSLQQNRYMWKLLSEIAQEVNGDYADEDIYCQAIELANIQKDTVLCSPDIEKSLKQSYRVVAPREFVKGKNDIMWRYYDLYRGSSHFNTKEMTVLIDTILDMACNAGLDRDYWKGLLYEEI